MDQQLPSKLLQAAVDELSRLPGVGKKTALRFALHLIKQPQADVERFGKAFIALRNEIKHCSVCNTLSDTGLCEICSNLRRDRAVVCVVESIREVLSIENTRQYNGTYHVLGGIISPMDGIGPNDLKIDLLLERVSRSDIKEVVLALSTTMGIVIPLRRRATPSSANATARYSTP